LRTLGEACNEAGVAVLNAEAHYALADDVFRRSWEREEQGEPFNIRTWVAEEYNAACREHVERLTAIYAAASAQYAVCAIEAASRVANGGQPVVPSLPSTPPSDVLLMAQLHVPLLQIPARAVAAKWLTRLDRENVQLADIHRRLTAAKEAVESPAVAFDVPREVTQRQTAYLLESEFPAVLHDYASACAFALVVMCDTNDESE
jgi:hypothetical protein